MWEFIMGLKKYLSCLMFVFMIGACSNRTPSIAPSSDSLQSIVVHAREGNCQYDDFYASMTFNTIVGSDISNFKMPTKAVYDDHPVLIKGIFVDKEETTLIKASQLKKYDGSFHDLYILYYYIGNTDDEYCFDPTTDFDGEYTNSRGNRLTINRGELTGNFGDIHFTTSNIEKNQTIDYKINRITYYFDDIVVYSSDLGQDNLEGGFSYRLCNYYIDGNNLTTIKNDVTKCGILFLYLCDAIEKYKNEEPPEIAAFLYTKNNTFSIDFDL